MSASEPCREGGSRREEEEEEGAGAVGGGALTALRAIGDARGRDAAAAAALGLLAIAAVLEDAVGRGDTAISTRWKWQARGREVWSKPGGSSEKKTGEKKGVSFFVLVEVRRSTVRVAFFFSLSTFESHISSVSIDCPRSSSSSNRARQALFPRPASTSRQPHLSPED